MTKKIAKRKAFKPKPYSVRVCLEGTDKILFVEAVVGRQDALMEQARQEQRQNPVEASMRVSHARALRAWVRRLSKKHASALLLEASVELKLHEEDACLFYEAFMPFEEELSHAFRVVLWDIQQNLLI